MSSDSETMIVSALISVMRCDLHDFPVDDCLMIVAYC